MESINIKSTSRQSAVCSDIEIRTTSKSKLVFRPEIVNNTNEPSASVKGTFFYLRKNPSEEWEVHKELNLSQMRSGEGFQLELKSAELLDLYNKLTAYYQIHGQHGIKYGENNYLITPNNVTSNIEALLKDPKSLEKLSDLKIEDLEKLNEVSRINSFKSVLLEWNQNKTNSSEEYWQKFLEENSWIITQVFSMPVMLFQQKAYLGGKNISNQGGRVIDFIYQNKYTQNVALVEIKTPQTKIIGSQYRNTYALNPELSGSITQLLSYKYIIQKDYNALAESSERSFSVFNPKCLLIIGCMEHENLNKEQLAAFELCRRDSMQLEIITFDELFEKISNVLNILEPNIPT